MWVKRVIATFLLLIAGLSTSCLTQRNADQVKGQIPATKPGKSVPDDEAPIVSTDNGPLVLPAASSLATTPDTAPEVVTYRGTSN
jgi:hypothetical protein